MGFEYRRTIRFHETDAAGVVYFANVLVLCHEAYEASLADHKIDLSAFFSPTGDACPIINASTNFHRPLRCGDSVTIHLTPRLLAADSFEISYRIYKNERTVATALTRHVCISANRQRIPLSNQLVEWIERLGTA